MMVDVSGRSVCVAYVCVHVLGVYCEQAVGKALSDLKAAERCASGPCLHAKSCQELVSIYPPPRALCELLLVAWCLRFFH